MEGSSSASAERTAGARTAPDSLPPPPAIGGYRVDGELGRGGMARVYRVVDDATGRQLALKQLHVKQDHREQGAALFEREFHTLAQLKHPSVIEVYDYGIAERGPYYTMELLDGGDIRTRSPMPWREACQAAFDVCSSLALLHSRRLVHRDITPRNVRCTQSGRAKLIDFGAMAPMGPGGQAVGTPAFIAPEVMHRSLIDGRADLFSLGATLYFALTGRVPFSARELSRVIDAWRVAPAAPSQLVDGIPVELDSLVMTLLSIEPALRPRSAYEVMERLHVLAGIERDESLGVSQAYLVTPALVGRQEPLAMVRHEMQRALNGRGRGLLVRADAGLGRSRLLDAFALEAKLLGATCLHANATGEQVGNLAVAHALVAQLIDAHPDAALARARELGESGPLAIEGSDDDAADATPPQRPRMSLRPYPEAQSAQLALQNALAQWFLRVSTDHPLFIAVDDVDRIDEPSAALLAALAHHARRHRLLLAVTCEEARGAVTPVLDVLANQCTNVPLRALDQPETEMLLGSVFGDVPNLALLADRVHSVAVGRPRNCMALAQHLVARGVIAYAAGSWTLPERLALADMPRRAEDVFRARVAALQPLARKLACLHAHALTDTLGRDDYLVLEPSAGAAAIDRAIGELLAQDVLRGDHQSYALAQRELRDVLRERVPEPERRELHRALAELAELRGRRIEAISHQLSAGLSELAIERTFAAFDVATEPQMLEKQSLLPFNEIALVIERVLDAAEALQRKPRELFELRRWLFLCSVAADDRLHKRCGPMLLAQLEHDSGLAWYRRLDDVADPMQRIMQALQRAAEQYAATPESERVYRVDEAITQLVYYVLISIAVGARTFDGELIGSLPALLEPFASLTPAVDAIWQNAIATCEVMTGSPQRAHARWLELYTKLEHLNDSQLQRVDLIRNAIAYGLGMVDAQIGREAVGRWAAVLDKDPLQQVNAMNLRRALCLHRGDLQSAERFRRKAEVMAVQATTRQMFATVSIVDINIASMSRDLTGIKHIAERIAPLAAQYPGWQQFANLAQIHFHRLRGDLVAALAECERALELAAPGGVPRRASVLAWCAMATAYIDTLVETGRCAQARDYGVRALASCLESGADDMAHEIGRALALAEGKLGDLDGAAARLDAIIVAQQAYGGHGLILGATYEARARVAIWAADSAAVERFGQLAAHEYRHGRATPLGARYERLTQEARNAGMAVLPQLDSFAATTHVGPTALGGVRATIEHSVTSALNSAEDAAARAQVALQLVCDAHAAPGGHLYVLRDDGLVLAASSGSREPDEQLRRFVTAFWQRHLMEPDLPTTFVPEGSPTPATSSELWTDGHGTPYQPILITTTVRGDLLHVGVVALIPSERPSRNASAIHVVGTVGSYLLSSGDAIAVEA